MKGKVERQGDWYCVICQNLNFSFREECNRCKLVSREQNDHQFRMNAYAKPCFLTPLRKKQDICSQQYSPSTDGPLLSVSPVLRQLGI